MVPQLFLSSPTLALGSPSIFENKSIHESINQRINIYKKRRRRKNRKHVNDDAKSFSRFQRYY